MTTMTKEKPLTQGELFDYADQFLRKHFNMKMNVPLRISKRMKTTLGHFKLKQGEPAEIALSYDLIQYNTRDMVLDTLYHECVHYALFTHGKPYRDRDGYFKRTLDRLGISRTRQTRAKVKTKVYQCVDCGEEYESIRSKLDDIKKYRCSICYNQDGSDLGVLKFIGIFIK